MKRLIGILAIGFVLMATQAVAFEAAMVSGAITSSSQACSGKCYLSGLTVYTDGNSTSTHDATVAVYDGTSASGKEITRMKVFGGLFVDKLPPFAYPIFCNDGIYVSISGTDAGAIVEYMKK
jgi:hypothetical protein